MITTLRTIVLGVLGASLLAACAPAHCPQPSASPPRPATVKAGPTTPLAAAQALCHTKDARVYHLVSDRFRQAVPERKIRGRLLRLRRQLGPCTKVVHRGGPRFRLIHQRGILPVRIIVRQGRVAGLWFRPVIHPNDTLASILAAFKHLPGKVALTVRQAGQPALASVRSNNPLAVASTFKLYILEALHKEILAGRMRWDDRLPLRPRWLSGNPSLFSRWPAGTPLTLATLATLMISRSDNSATDHLLFHLGRPLVEKLAGPRNRPLLSTRELFLLKTPKNNKLAQRYLAAKTPAARLALLNTPRLTRAPLRTIRSWSRPRYIHRLEWFFTTNELCDVMLRLKSLKPLSANRGLARRTRAWRQAAFKGGSEPGVRNHTYALQHRRTKRWTCVSVTWNDTTGRRKPRQFRSLVSRLLQHLARHESQRQGR